MLNGWSSELQENSSWNKRIKNIFDEKSSHDSATNLKQQISMNEQKREP